jgi:hypothetical protein
MGLPPFGRGLTPVDYTRSEGGLPPWIKNGGLPLSNKIDNSPNGKWVCSYYCNIERNNMS